MVLKSDEDLYREYRDEKSDSSFQQIYLRHSGPLFRFIYRFTANQQATDDVVQDIFMELLSGKFSGSGPGHLKNWLYTVAKNKGLNWIKGKRNETADELVLENLDAGVDSEAQLIHTDLLEHLGRLESKLPHELLSTWSLRKSGLDNAQIANRTAGAYRQRSFS